MLDQTTIESIADELVQADLDRAVLPKLTSRYPGMVIEDSYAIQKVWSRAPGWSATRSA